MLSISFRFLSGRYHATPWDRHPNEGVVEWPPSPWRLLRAFVAAWHKLEQPGDKAILLSLIEKLAEPPSFTLPHSSVGHTRQYMPTREGTTLVFDSFVAVGGGASARDNAISATWQHAELDAAHIELLDRLLEQLGYLGRAESWVEATRVTDAEAANVMPTVAEGERNTRTVRLKAAMSAADFRAWRNEQGDAIRKLEANDILDALSLDTTYLRKAGWSDSPGSRYVAYAVPEHLIQPRRNIRSAAVRKFKPPTIARFAIAGSVRPRLIDTLYVGETMRRAAIAKADRAGGLSMPLFAGKSSDGVPLNDQKHAFYLPADDDYDGYIDHITVWARAGLDEEAIRVLQSIDTLFMKGGVELRLALLSLARPDVPGAFDAMGRDSALLGSGQIWQSTTPVVLTRHPKKRADGWKDSSEEQIERMIVQIGLPAPKAIRSIPQFNHRSQDVRWERFATMRSNGGGKRAPLAPMGFRIEFDRPVPGPIALGYAGHMGLGQFRRVEE